MIECWLCKDEILKREKRTLGGAAANCKCHLTSFFHKTCLRKCKRNLSECFICKTPYNPIMAKAVLDMCEMVNEYSKKIIKIRKMCKEAGLSTHIDNRTQKDISDLLEIRMRHIRNNPLICKVTPYSTDTYIQMIQHDGMFLQYISNQSEEMCMEAIKQNINSLQFVKDEFKITCENFISEQYPNVFNQVEVILTL